MALFSHVSAHLYAENRWHGDAFRRRKKSQNIFGKISEYFRDSATREIISGNLRILSQIGRRRRFSCAIRRRNGGTFFARFCPSLRRKRRRDCAFRRREKSQNISAKISEYFRENLFAIRRRERSFSRENTLANRATRRRFFRTFLPIFTRKTETELRVSATALFSHVSAHLYAENGDANAFFPTREISEYFREKSQNIFAKNLRIFLREYSCESGDATTAKKFPKTEKISGNFRTREGKRILLHPPPAADKMALEISSKYLFPIGPLNDTYIFGKNRPLSVCQRVYAAGFSDLLGRENVTVQRILNFPPESASAIWEEAWLGVVSDGLVQAGRFVLNRIPRLERIQYSPASFTYQNLRDPYGVGRPSAWEIVISSLQKDVGRYTSAVRDLTRRYTSGELDLLPAVEERQRNAAIAVGDPAPDLPTPILAQIVKDRSKEFLHASQLTARTVLLNEVLASLPSDEIAGLEPLNLSETYRLGFYVLDLAHVGKLQDILDRLPQFQLPPLPQTYLERVAALASSRDEFSSKPAIAEDSEFSPFSLVTDPPLVVDGITFPSVTHFGIYYVLRSLFRDPNPARYNSVSPADASQQFFAVVAEQKHQLFWKHFEAIAKKQFHGEWGPLFIQTLGATVGHRLVYENPYQHDEWTRHNIVGFYEALRSSLPSPSAPVHPVEFMTRDAYGAMIVQGKTLDFVNQLNVIRWVLGVMTPFDEIAQIFESIYGVRDVLDRMPRALSERSLPREYVEMVENILDPGPDTTPAGVAAYLSRFILLQLAFAADRLGSTADAFHREMVVQQFFYARRNRTAKEILR